jgi:hypothetical protein
VSLLGSCRSTMRVQGLVSPVDDNDVSICLLLTFLRLISKAKVCTRPFQILFGQRTALPAKGALARLSQKGCRSFLMNSTQWFHQQRMSGIYASPLEVPRSTSIRWFRQVTPRSRRKDFLHQNV